jgi:molybdopterin-guanine dinucleotide biosynthesis protein A
VPTPGYVSFTGLLLAGGLSTRMGRDKATLRIQGEPLWSRQLALLKKLEPKALWVSARTPPAWLPPNVEVLLDEPPSRGPLSGIARALERIETTHLLVLAIDLPEMSSAHLQKLAGFAKPGRGVIPATSRHFEPLAAIYPKAAAAAAAHSLLDGKLALQAFARVLLEAELVTEYRLTTEERALYLNVNTPSDLLGGRVPET